MKPWHHLPDLYFLHIPKTAGTSVRAWAEGLFPADAILPVHHLQPMEDMPDEAIRSARFASGHLGWRFFERRERLKPIEVFTFLRETLALRMSMLGYAHEVPEDAFSELAGDVAERTRKGTEAARSSAMVEFVTSDSFDVARQVAAVLPLNRRLQNSYVLHLAGAGGQASEVIEVTDETCHLAASRLDGMLSVGVVEDMAGSMALLCDRLGLPYLPLGRVLNKSEKKLKPSAKFGEFVRHVASYNVQLHDHATNLVAERKADLLASYGVATVEALATPMRHAFLTTDRGVERAKEADITMADGLVTEGFAQRLFYEPYNRWIRWAGQEATLYLPLDRSADRAIRFEVATTMTDPIRDGLTLSVEGRDIPLTRTYEKWPDGWHLICEGTIPAGDAVLQYTALDFEAPEDVAVTDYPDSMGVRAAWALADVRVG